MKNVLCISETCCDMIFPDMPGAPRPGEELYGSGFLIKAGGGANTALSLSRLGIPTAFFTAIGDDTAGSLMLDIMGKSGLTLKGSIRKENTRTAVTAVICCPVDRCFASYAGSFVESWSREDLREAIAEADIVHTYPGYCIAHDLHVICEELGKTLSLDCSWSDAADPETARRVLPYAGWFKCNENEACRIAGREDPAEALKVIAGRVKCGAVVTCGGEGSIGMLHGSEEILRQSICSTGEFRDACGAGDNFAAGLLYGISAGRSLREAMGCGAAAAGLSVTWDGGNDESLTCTKVEEVFRAEKRK